MKLEILYTDNSYKAMKVNEATIDQSDKKLYINTFKNQVMTIDLNHKIIKEIRLDKKTLYRYDGYIKELDEHVYTIINKI